MDKKSILIFGAGELQLSIIKKANKMGLFTVGIDPCEDAYSRSECDAFEVVGGQDYEGTLAVAMKYNISAIVTAATDKPLVMMARLAQELDLPFYSVATAEWSTDKYQMKQRFIEWGVPCAQGRLIRNAGEARDLYFPVICKPRDNSGSRGVKFCRDLVELQESVDEALQFSKLDSVLVEEYIEGKEYSVEALHYDGKFEIIQFTEKQTTEFPYNVEIGHMQPATITIEQKKEICEILHKMSISMRYENCASHTELKINDRGIFIIETSPRLGGDFITSLLTPISTGINIEEQLINIALNNPVDTVSNRHNKAAGVRFLSLPTGIIEKLNIDVKDIMDLPNMVDFKHNLRENQQINKIKNSLERYGYFVIKASNVEDVNKLMRLYEKTIYNNIKIIN